jgi:tRNA threonylcarbamoyladenosine biosynthesis protein TsaB
VIIAIESASTDPSVALATPAGELIGVAGWRADRGQARELLPRLLELLAAHGRRLEEATALAVGIGPGSFTGLRVGMSLGKGFAYALRRPIVGVPSLPAWLAAEPDALAAVGRAGAREVYLLLHKEDEPRIAPVEALPEGARSGAVVAPAEVAEAFGLSGARPPTRAAASIAAMAAQRLAAIPDGDDLATLEPTYLRAPRGLTASAAPGMEVAPWP